jgi:hypothetical protein
LKEIPLGNVAPPSPNVGLGNSDVVTVNELNAPTVNVVLFRLVKLGA